MTEKSIAGILASYEQIAPHINDMVADFYVRVFKAAPEARAMFRQDMTLQQSHLSATLALLVRNYQYNDVLEEMLMDLGAYHVKVGVKPEQYPVIRVALLESVAARLGENWTDQLSLDWSEMIDHIIAVMLKGATLFALKQAEMKAKPSPARA